MECPKKAKIANHQIVFREFPDEVTLAINFSNCPCNCPGCHSSYLAGDVGEQAYLSYITNLIKKHPEITCVGLMGGDAYPEYILYIAYWIETEFNLRVGWYSGMTRSLAELRDIGGSYVDYLTYYKVGPYVEEFGGLDNPNTNQIMLMNRQDGQFWENITYKFRKI